MCIKTLSLIIILAPLLGSIAAGLFQHQLSIKLAQRLTIMGVGISFVVSLLLAYGLLTHSFESFNANLYTWASGGILFPYSFHIGLLIDPLTVVMLLVVTFVSLLVHIYSIGYMEGDPGVCRFFSYISLFTFMMLMLVTANNFLQLFFGWEGVGLVSYLLIGFWFKKDSATSAGIKAFIVNRFGDFGFILGIGLLLAYTGSLDYETIFQQAPAMATQTIRLFSNHEYALITVTTLLLYVGAMGKSAQVPLHVWLPESMEGPTPISALIHAATMVTAGVFMIARISPLVELSTTTLSVIMVIGAIGALFMGLLALVMNDIKRVVAYSTLSQLGYMMVAMGASAYAAGIFHLITHACFKALLFLAAGSVIIGMHHEQDMTKMGGLKSKMPITYYTFLIGSLALCALPPFSGFYSKDTIIEMTKLSVIPGAGFAYFCVAAGAMVTAIYTFRALFMTFHGTPRMSQQAFNSVHESPSVVWVPLVLLAIPSVLIGYVLFQPMLHQVPALLGNAITVLPEHKLSEAAAHHLIHTPGLMALHALTSPIFYLTLLGIFIAWLCYLKYPVIPIYLASRFKWLNTLLVDKYGFDCFNNRVIVSGSKAMGRIFYRHGDRRLIDGLLVNGSASTLAWFAKKGKFLQSGYLYHYVGVMVLGLFVLLSWLLLG